MLNLFDVDDRHQFYDTRLNPLIEHARHAVALDEVRGPLTLWPGAQPDGDRSMRQVWFPGDHCDVGVVICRRSCPTQRCSG
ncbi:MAG: phospholipase effector Tle1 domain-containing protein [Pseudonocardiaceae bacterium]